MNYFGVISLMGKKISELLANIYAVYKAENNANDSLGTYNGTAQGGLTYTTGKSGNGFIFNGSNAYVQLPDNAFNSLSGSFSVSAWFKTGPAINNRESYILFNASMNSWFNNPNGFQFYHYGQKFILEVFNNTNTYVSCQTGGSLSVNTWYHVVCTKLVNGNINIYVNGSLAATTVTTVNPTYLATVSKPCIGALNVPNRVPSVGVYADNGVMVDELNVWNNRELSATEVTDLYNSGTGKFYPTF